MTEKINIFDMELGTSDDGKKLTIENIDTEEVNFKDGKSATKVVIFCKTEDGQDIRISEAWTDIRKEKKVQGLWVKTNNSNQILPMSTLGKLIAYHELGSIKDLVNKEVQGYSDTNGYTVLTTFDMDTSENKSTSVFS